MRCGTPPWCPEAVVGMGGSEFQGWSREADSQEELWTTTESQQGQNTWVVRNPRDVHEHQCWNNDFLFFFLGASYCIRAGIHKENPKGSAQRSQQTKLNSSHMSCPDSRGEGKMLCILWWVVNWSHFAMCLWESPRRRFWGQPMEFPLLPLLTSLQHGKLILLWKHHMLEVCHTLWGILRKNAQSVPSCPSALQGQSLLPYQMGGL